jgi:hypothetical protein
MESQVAMKKVLFICTGICNILVRRLLVRRQVELILH